MINFAGPALALWLTGPLLSLIDASTVGLADAVRGQAASAAPALAAASTATEQLAALGPATTFIDGSAFLFAFINVATTNLYAAALAKGDAEEGAGLAPACLHGLWQRQR